MTESIENGEVSEDMNRRLPQGDQLSQLLCGHKKTHTHELMLISTLMTQWMPNEDHQQMDDGVNLMQNQLHLLET